MLGRLSLSKPLGMRRQLLIIVYFDTQTWLYG
nr:MAG TPA: hypothetical protein [Caudoviricetes sp.]